jgi:hypothetical protein
VLHHKKSEYAKAHLLKCAQFARLMAGTPIEEQPEWFTTKKSKKGTKTSSSSQRSIRQFALPLVPAKTRSRFQELISLHYHLTGTSFLRVEDPTLAAAISLLRPDQNLLPDRKQVAGRLLDKNFDKVKTMCQSFLKDKTLYFCLTTDGWSNVCNDPIVNYMAVCPQKTIFLESVPTWEQSHSAEWIATDIERVIKSHPDSRFCGAVTDNTSANRSAWMKLKLIFPNLFFQGCMSHGLHLLVKDIFAPSKTLRNADQEGDAAAFPSGYPFEHLLNFAEDCKELVKYFHNHHVAKAGLARAQAEAGVVSLVKPAPTR